MKILLLNQCFYPDVVSTAQYLTDLAVELSLRGHSVTVLASSRGYDDPRNRFPSREHWKGISIIRISSLALGKTSRWRRAIGFGSYLLSCALRLLVLPKFDCVVAMTSPPLISFLAALFARVKGARFVFWIMDLNPDEAIAAGWLREKSLVALLLSRMLRFSLQQADRVVVLDRFMRDRLLRKGVNPETITTIPPWSHDDEVCFSESARCAFRSRYGLQEKFVVMYSGNHSPCHPLMTALAAAEKLSGDQKIVFCFVGGGSEFSRVQRFARERELANIVCLPYQSRRGLSALLSSADLHLVIMGDAFKGIVHPCKIYNILLTGKPILGIGPEESHLTDIFRNGARGFARFVRHGQTELVVQHIIDLAKAPSRHPRKVRLDLTSRFSKKNLLPELIEAVVPRQEAFTSVNRAYAALADG
jgi:colanic acid biosynthesis glycosyl transferase WcaI